MVMATADSAAGYIGADWKMKKTYLSLPVTRYHTNQGYMSVCYGSKDEDGVGMSADVDTDFYDCMSIDTIQKTGKRDSTPGTVEQIDVKIKSNPK